MAVDTAPSVLAASATLLESGQQWALDETDVTRAERLLAAGHATPPTAPLAGRADVLQGLRWYALEEVGGARTTGRTAVDAQPLPGAWSGLWAARRPAVLVVGADEQGRAAVTLGLPDDPEVIGQWLSDQAPDLLWTPVDVPPGWSVVLDEHHDEVALIPRPVAAAPRPAAAEAPTALPALTALLSVAAAGWCVAVVLDPEPTDVVARARDRLMALRLRAASRLTRSESVTEGTSRSTTDPRIESVLDNLTAWQGLVDDCAQAGGWRVGVRIAARDPRTLAVVQAATSTLLTARTEAVPQGRTYQWDASGVAVGADGCAWSWLSSHDLAALLVPPSDALGSVQVRRALPGGRRSTAPERPIVLGTWLGTSLPAALDVDDLGGHAFIAGITGSGKSTTTARILLELWNVYSIPFLVLDPAKADYEDLSGGLRGGLRVVSAAELAMNVLQPWPGRPPERHIAAVSAAFRASFGMPVPVPYVASLLLEELADEASSGQGVSLHDAAARLPALIEDLGYRGEIEDNIKASLGLRLRMLLHPRRAERYAGNGPPTWLVERPTLVRLGDIGDDEERAFATAMLVLYVGDAARAAGESRKLRHVTVVEEAHRLMPEPRSGGSHEDGDAASVAARLMTQLLAEIRAYGESVIVVDQSPAAVAREVLRNTNVKLAHRVVDADDQRALGGALGLDEDESRMLGSLGVGRCLLSSRQLLRPQAVAVEPPDLDGPPLVVPVPPAAASPCHQTGDAAYHHRAEAAGSSAELMVSLWAAGASPSDLVALMRPVMARATGTRAACLMNVGIRRHTAALRRLGQLASDVLPAHASALWAAAVARGTPPPHPAAGTAGPFPACTKCPSPCTVRSAVASGAVSALQRAPSIGSSPAAVVALAYAESVTVELQPGVGTPLAQATGFCAAVHHASAHGYDQALARALEGALSGGGHA